MSSRRACAGIDIDLEAAETEQTGGRLAAPAAQNRLDPGKQLARLEGLGQIIVGAELQPDDAVHGVAARGEHEDRGVAPGADAPAHFEAVEVGQHQIEDEQVEMAAAVLIDGVEAGRGDGNVILRLAEVVGDHLGKAGIVFDQQDSSGHGL